MMRVSAGIVRYPDGRILICRRGEGRKNAHLWEFPGGKLESGETPEHALERELNEELGIETRAGRVIDCIADWQGANGQGILLMFYECEIISGEPRSIDNGGVRIVPERELMNIPLARNDRIFAQRHFEGKA